MESSYKMYISAMKSTITGIDPNIKDITITGWMQDIASIFPYYRHTNPNTMAIAMYLIQKHPESFVKSEATSLVLRSSFNYVGKKDIVSVVIDVARYWKRLAAAKQSSQ